MFMTTLTCRFAVGPPEAVDALATMYRDLKFCREARACLYCACGNTHLESLNKQAWKEKSKAWDGVYMSPEICPLQILAAQGIELW